MPRNDEDAIRQRAYEIWEREGRQHGMHVHHWDRASREIVEEHSALLQTDTDPLAATQAEPEIAGQDYEDKARPDPLTATQPDGLAAVPTVGLTSMGVPSAGPAPTPLAAGRGKPKRSG